MEDLGPHRAPAEAPPTDEQLWSWIDRKAPELDAYLAAHPEAQSRVHEFESAIARFEASEPAVVIPTQIGEYEIRGVLGRGGMGVVYDAEQKHPRRRVALKVLPGEFAGDELWQRRFRREADALARLSHPGIASIFGVGRGEDGRPHIAMELVEGRPLGQYLAEAKLTTRERIVLAQKLCQAVGHAHDQGVIHRDIKPANVLVNEAGDPVVVDFGLASIEGEQLSRASLMSREGTLLGTLPYMSPEQVTAQGPLAANSDVYSLGVVVFELLTGEMPYDLTGLNLVAAAGRIQTARPKWKGRGQRVLRGDLSLVLRKALEKDASRRYASASEFAADLRRLLDGRAVEAVAAPLFLRALYFLRRHWFGSTFAAAMLVAAYFVVLPPQAAYPMFPAWWMEGSPFEELRWNGEQPEVLVEERWYELVAIDELKVGFITGFCQQTSDRSWRKRFSEDLVQVLNRLGVWWLWSVDLSLRDLVTGELVVKEDVRMSSEYRRNIWSGRRGWPWRGILNRERGELITIDGNSWQLLSVDGVPADRFGKTVGYDAYCELLGRSPGQFIDFIARDLTTGEEREFEGVRRVTPIEWEKQP